MEFNFIEPLLLLISVYLLYTVTKMDGRIEGLKNQLNRMAKQMDLPEPPVNDEVRQLLHEGKDVQAVKRVRETLGLSLVEAKEYVDELKSFPNSDD